MANEEKKERSEKREKRIEDKVKARKGDGEEDDRDHKRKAKKDKERKKKHSSSSSRKRGREKDRDRKRSSDRRRRKKKESERSRKKRRKKYYSSSSDDSSSSSSDSGSSSSDLSDVETKPKSQTITKQKVVNKRLLAKLAARGETLEEREERRAERRAARITAQFGYTATDNPFNDPDIAQPFTWKKKTEVDAASASQNNVKMNTASRKEQQDKTFVEIEKVRKRRKDYEEQKEEMERIRAEESRMKEHEKYDDWAQKEELFHLQQQRHRSAIRLVEGREKPIDVLAKNLLLFGLTNEQKKNRASVKYKEKYNALEEVEALEAELEEPHLFINCLKLNELEELLVEIEAFRTLEGDVGDIEHDDNSDSNESIVKYWENLHLVTKAEIQHIRSHHSGVEKDNNIAKDIQTMFEGQSKSALKKMQEEVESKIKKCLMGGGKPVFDEKGGGVIDLPYWQTVLDQLLIYLAKMELSDLHSKMLVCQLEKLEQKKEDLEKKQNSGNTASSARGGDNSNENEKDDVDSARPKDVAPDFGNLEEELGLTSEIDLGPGSYNLEKYRPRKPRYFNRVKTGYDWNKYNQTHYDHDNPPPKIVQGYKFNIFYPDLFDKTITPKYTLEPTDSPEFCIIRFSCGPPYEDIAFKIINRQWNKSRKRGFRCTFERGVLSLYINFATHWYRR